MMFSSIAIVEGRGVARGEIGMSYYDPADPVLTLSQFSDSQTYIKLLAKLHNLQPAEVKDLYGKIMTSFVYHYNLLFQFLSTASCIVKFSKTFCLLRTFCIEILIPIKVIWTWL